MIEINAEILYQEIMQRIKHEILHKSSDYRERVFSYGEVLILINQLIKKDHLVNPLDLEEQLTNIIS